MKTQVISDDNQRSSIFKSTKRRIVLTCLLVVMSGLVIFASATLLFYNASLYGGLDTEINLLTDRIERMGLDKFINQPNDSNLPIRGPVNGIMPRPISPKTILMIFENGEPVFHSPNSYFEAGEVPVLPNESNYKIVNFKYNNYNFRGKTLLLDSHSIVILSNIDAEVESLDRLFQVILICFCLLTVISLLLSQHLASKVLKSIQKSYDAQVHFVQDASHEMRTPLAVIKGKLELLAIHPHDTIEDHIEQISELMGELRGIEKLNKDLLALSKEDVDTSVNKTEFKLSELIHELSDFYGVLSQIQNKNFILIMPVEISIFQDYQKLKQALTILLENAFKYTCVNDSITLRCEKSERHISIAVCDTGIGIMQKDIDRIFERFFRSDDVRAQGISGSGIGLSLLKSLSRILGFTINVESKYGVGSEFTLIFRVKNKISHK